MRKFFMAFLCLALLCPAAMAQSEPANDANIEIKEGTVLTYDVRYEDQQYMFKVTVKSLSNGVTFDWQMTAPVNENGTIVMTPSALKSATSLFNYFESGTTKLTDQTSVWLSSKVYKMITENKDVTLNTGETETEFVPSEPASYYDMLYNNKQGHLNTYELRQRDDEENGNIIVVWKNEKFPLIIKMDLGFTIHLAKIDNPE